MINNITIDDHILELDFIHNFIVEYDFPSDLKLKMIVTDDMEKEYVIQQKLLKKEYDYVSPFDYNGITCVPNNISEETLILINYDRVNSYKENNCEVICTIFHELIHARDYYNYFKKYFDGIYTSSVNRNATYGFTNWSEFNAKKISYLEYCKLLHGDKLYSKEELENILLNELPNKNKQLEEDLSNDNLDLEDIIYSLMLYLGRYSVWEMLFPNEFKNGKKFPNKLLICKTIIDELYNCLKNNCGTVENYIEIKNNINYFKGAWAINVE